MSKNLKRLIFIIGIIAGLAGWIISGERPQVVEALSGPVAFVGQLVPANDNLPPRLSERRRIHILYGDESGGGHLHGVNKPCKTEFPENWDAQQVIKTVKALAANDNVIWHQEDNGYYVSEQDDGGLVVRVVLDREGDDIVTAYPVNVPSNPCDKN
ncbi:MAG: EndoU domain-containing protein [Rhodospirillales bacterium]|nr:EndoU domain-containing protein [Rhodospirillales bacterium]